MIYYGYFILLTVVRVWSCFEFGRNLGVCIIRIRDKEKVHLVHIANVIFAIVLGSIVNHIAHLYYY